MGDPPHYVLSIEKAVLDFRPVDVQLQAALPDLRGQYQVQGIVTSFSESSLEMIADNVALIPITLEPNVKIELVTLGKVGSTAGSLSQIAVGDRVLVARIAQLSQVGDKLVENGFMETVKVVKNTTAEQKARFGSFKDKDLGSSVAKALIHAIVLCHKNAAPSLF